MSDSKKSNGIVKKDGVMSSYPQDNAGGMELPDTKGCKMGGSTTNLAHSLKGTSAVQK